MAYGHTLDGLKPSISATVDRVEKHEFGWQKPRGSQASDPIPIPDDDNLDAREITYIDLEKDHKASFEEHCTSPIKQATAGPHDLRLQLPDKRLSRDNYTQEHGTPKPTGSSTQPLFRPLTKDDLLDYNAQPLPNTRSIGFKAWYGKNDSHHKVDVAPAVRRKEARLKSGIGLFNEDRSKNAARVNRDAPQFAMSVLKSNCKRTMVELGYNELISPGQIESPSEKMARRAKRRRQRQEKCDLWPQTATAGEAQRVAKFNHLQTHENDSIIGGNSDLALSPILHEPPERQDIVAGMNDECKGPSDVCAPSLINTCSVSDNQSDHATKQRRKDHTYSHVGDYGSQNTDHDRDAQGYGDGKIAGCPSGNANCKPTYRKPKVSGPTSVCGIFSPEKKPPVKRSDRGDFHCPRCDSQYTTQRSVNYHFEKCIAKHGNPMSLRWNDHPSLRKAGKGIFSINKNAQTITIPARIPPVENGSTNTTHDIKPEGRPASNDVVPPSLSSDIPVPDPFRSTPPISEEQASDPCNRPQLSHQVSTAHHYATGGKGLSAETLKTFRETGRWECGIDLVDKAQDDETETPEVAYQYFVLKREWLETEEDASTLNIGPYHTLGEANAVAKVEVQCPQIDGFEGVQCKGWSYCFRQDEYGMQTHLATILEINIETAVRRELAPANERISIPMSAFVVAQRVYIVHELQWLADPKGSMGALPSHCQSLTHGAYSLLQKANQRAAAEYLESLTGNWGDSEYDLLRKMERKSDMEKKVRALNREEGLFCEEITLENDGFAKVWVELVVVEGPRN